MRRFGVTLAAALVAHAIAGAVRLELERRAYLRAVDVAGRMVAARLRERRELVDVIAAQEPRRRRRTWRPWRS